MKSPRLFECVLAAGGLEAGRIALWTAFFNPMIGIA